MRHFLLMLLLFSSLASAAMTMTRELIAPDHLVPGQPARVAVTFWTDSWFNPPPAWPVMSVENGTLLTTALPNQLVSRLEGETSWSGIRMERQLMAWDKGMLRLPAMDVTLQSAGQPPQTVTLPAIEQKVTWPADVQQPDRFLPASALSLQQKWQIWRAEGSSTVHVGDVIERQITVEAHDVIPAQIPQILFSIPGTGSQRLTPVNSLLTSGRNEVTGARRVERLRYLPAQPGKLTLPEVRLRWWDTRHQQWQLATLPAATYTIAPARAEGSESALRAAGPDPLRHLILFSAVIMVLALLAWWLRHRLWRALRFVIQRWLQVWRIVPLPELSPRKRKKR
ncbi:oxygen tolerance domain protein [Erwinia sp. E_sp_B04_8]|uniref:oxygen tolerance domain protein n=1 Tax=unclassified Erwinia TaxID=2622719 RepID=UPI0030CBBD93